MHSFHHIRFQFRIWKSPKSFGFDFGIFMFFIFVLFKIISRLYPNSASVFLSFFVIFSSERYLVSYLLFLDFFLIVHSFATSVLFPRFDWNHCRSARDQLHRT